MDRVREAAERVVAVQMRYAQRGLGMAQAALAGATALEPWRHHPRHDVIDTHNASQFYYHAHGSLRSPAAEHGHFHLFTRLNDGPADFMHLVALSLDARGLPLRWFVTNRWVTGGAWADADTAIAALTRFAPQARGRMAPVGEWLTAMTVLHGGTIAALLRRRDAVVRRRLAHVDAESFFDDRSVDVITETRISLEHHLARAAGWARPPMAVAGEHS
ncbi:MAG TPA: hypothetical protein PK359_20740 [Burkholderiaceae bacterium]|nr:hypothetical protein [Burkholderiaceae bacterium]